jgi:hypothetical protein
MTYDDPDQTFRLPPRRTGAPPPHGPDGRPREASYTASNDAQRRAASRARGLLDERYDSLLTSIQLRPYELWVLAEAIRLGMGHPSFSRIGADMDSPDIWDMARLLWNTCRERIKALDWELAEAMPQPR